MFAVTFREAAAGSTISEFIIRSPTHWIVIVTTTAMETVNSISTRSVLIPRLAASDWLMLTSSALLKISTQRVTTAANKTNSSIISSGLTLRMSPTRYDEYL